MDPERELIDEQIAYYRARAAEYDATSTPEGDAFEADTTRIRDALRAFAPRGRVLELAAGTGQWTVLLAEYADELLVTDASPEMLELNRARVGERPNVRYEPRRRLRPAVRHVRRRLLRVLPVARASAPLRGVLGWSGRLLAPGGRVFLVDEGLTTCGTRSGSTARPGSCAGR